MEKEIRYMVLDYIRGTNRTMMYLKVNYTDDTETVMEGRAHDVRRAYYKLLDIPDEVMEEIKALSSAAMGQRETTGGESDNDSSDAQYDVLTARGGGSLSKGGPRPNYYWRGWK